MRLGHDDALRRLRRHHHGTLCTAHADRGIDAVPAVYALDDADRVGIPIDRVKPKSSSRLQRERNLERDPRATLLIEHWDPDDWSQLWWVRAELLWLPDGVAHAVSLGDALAAAYPQYVDRPFDRLLVFRLVGATGWSSADR